MIELTLCGFCQLNWLGYLVASFQSVHMATLPYEQLRIDRNDVSLLMVRTILTLLWRCRSLFDGLAPTAHASQIYQNG
jgi:hypothetical protein